MMTFKYFVIRFLKVNLYKHKQNGQLLEKKMYNYFAQLNDHEKK
jgi:hypothetical protein